MLRNINPILSPDLLRALRAMGHGDDIVIADANFPAQSTAPCLRLDGISATDVLTAILTVMPLDNFVPNPALTMQPVEDPDHTPDIVSLFQKIINDVADNPAQIATLERNAFYAHSKNSFVVVQTGELRLYGNIILKKGVIFP